MNRILAWSAPTLFAPEFPALSSPNVGLIAFVLIGSYAIGCFNAGYYLVKWRTGQDIRATGSGNAGATNAARLLGRPGFVITFLVDLLKGVAAVGTAYWLGFDEPFLLPVTIAVIAGHNWPVQLSFRGGKGISTSLGALLIYDVRIVLVLAVLTAVVLLWVRRFTASGLAAFALCPFALLALRQPAPSVVCASVLALLLLASHHQNLREEWLRLQSSGVRDRGETMSASEITQ